MLKTANLPYAWMAVSLALALASNWLALKQPEYIAQIAAGRYEVAFVVTMLLITLAQSVSGLASNFLKNITLARIDRNMERTATRKVMSIPVSTLEQQDPQALISRITTDTTMISTFLMDLVISEPARLYYLISAFVILFKDYNPTLAFSVLLTIPLTFLGSFIGGRLMFGKADKVQTEIAGLTARLSEKIVNLPLIKSYTTEEMESHEGSRLLDGLLKAKEKKAWIELVNTTLRSALAKLPDIFVIFVGAAMILNGQITVAIFVGFYLYSNKCCTYVDNHIALWISMKTAQGATFRLSEIMTEKEESQTGISDRLQGDIRFDHVSFSYGDKKVLDDVSFSINDGTITALVGYSGCGKTTALNLIERFYEPASGTVSIGGRSIQDWATTPYRENIFYLSQNAPALDGTIKEAITFGLEKEYTDDQLWSAVDKAGARAIVEKLGGLNYRVGTSGTKLSGGQKQKLSLVRAFLSEHKYMILDEPTSALDIEAARDVQQALFQQSKGKTVLVVSHSASLIREADMILVFKDGKVHAQGTHAELSKSCQFYQELLRAQGMEG